MAAVPGSEPRTNPEHELILELPSGRLRLALDPTPTGAMLRRTIASQLGSGTTAKMVLGIEAVTERGDSVLVPFSTLCSSKTVVQSLNGAKAQVLVRGRAPIPALVACNESPEPSSAKSTTTTPSATVSTALGSAAPESATAAAELPDYIILVQGMIAAMHARGAIPTTVAEQLKAFALENEGEDHLEELNLAIALAKVDASAGTAADPANLRTVCLALVMAAAERAQSPTSAYSIPSLALAARERGADLSDAIRACIAAIPIAKRERALTKIQAAISNSDQSLAFALLTACVDGELAGIQATLSAIQARPATADDAAEEPQQSEADSTPVASPSATMESCMRAALVAASLASAGAMSEELASTIKELATMQNRVVAAIWDEFAHALDKPECEPFPSALGEEWKCAIAIGRVPKSILESVSVTDDVTTLHRLLVAVAGTYARGPSATASPAVGQIVAISSAMKSRGLISNAQSALIQKTVISRVSSARRSALLDAAEEYLRHKSEDGAFAALAKAVLEVAAGVTDDEGEDEAGEAPNDEIGAVDDDWPSVQLLAKLVELQDSVTSYLVASGQLGPEVASALKARLQAGDPALRAIWRVFLSTSDSVDLRHSLTIYAAMMKSDADAPPAAETGSAGTGVADVDSTDDLGTESRDDGTAHHIALARLASAEYFSDAQAAALAGMVGRGDPRALAALDGLESVDEAEVVDSLRRVADLAISSSTFAQRYAMTSDEATE